MYYIMGWEVLWKIFGFHRLKKKSKPKFSFIIHFVYTIFFLKYSKNKKPFFIFKKHLKIYVFIKTDHGKGKIQHLLCKLL